MVTSASLLQPHCKVTIPRKSLVGHTFLPSRNTCPPNAICHHSKRVFSFCFSITAREKPAKESKSLPQVRTLQDGLFCRAESNFRRGAFWGCVEGQLSRSSPVVGTAPSQSTHPTAAPSGAPCQPPSTHNACCRHVQLAHIAVVTYTSSGCWKKT